jgi:predicted O-linked N-acetylglucosamine transferase (SPINDLY family)
VSTLNTLLADAASHAAAGRIEAALASYDAVLTLSPTLAEAHYNVGALHYARSDLVQAERSFAAAMQHRPDWVVAPLAMGHLLYEAGRYADAQRAFERAVALDGQSVEALGNLGLTLQRRGRADLAQPYLERVRALAPSDTHAWFALRSNMLALGRLDDAVQDFLRFEATAPLSAELVVTGFMFSRTLGDPAYEAKYLPLALEWPYTPAQADLAAVTLARLQYCDVPRSVIDRLYRTYDRLQQQNRGDAEPFAHTRGWREAHEPVRVGYLSADFRAHVMGRILRGIVGAHDRSRFAVYLYSLTPEFAEDALTAEFRAMAQSFTVLAEVDDRGAARAIASDGIDVLVDLMGHSAGSRPGILLWKPAPVIATHLGYHGCIGLSQVDYKITDPYADLPDAADFQIEAPLPLDTCVLPARRVAPASASPLTRMTLGIPDDAIVFATFVALVKLSPRCLALWREILARVPRALLAFSPLSDAERPVYRRRLEGFGITAERIVLLPVPKDDAESRARYRLVDAVLDTLPYTGGDTTTAALDMNVPVVTRVGERHAERVGYSLHAHLGITETVAHSDEEYVALACRVAQDAPWRASLVAAIAARLPASGVADPARHTRGLEAVYLRVLTEESAQP